MLRYCYANDLAVTARGAGTGNYGQAVPLRGGVVLDLSCMDRIESIQPEGVAVCQPGVRLGALENEARKVGWELRCYPSTIVKASVGGFLGGGSGGIGSVAHGNLRDFNTVRALEVVTMEAEPRVVLHEGEAVHEILHAWGTNGVISRIWLALAPAVEWSQCAVAFETLRCGVRFQRADRERRGMDQATGHNVRVADSVFLYAGEGVRSGGQGADLFPDRVVTARCTGKRGAGGWWRSELFGRLHWTAHASAAFRLHLESHDAVGHERRRGVYLSPVRVSTRTRVREQMRKLKERFGKEFLFHMEFWKGGDGRVVPGAIPVVYYTTEERLNEMIDYCREIGVFVANPHVNNVEGGGRYRADNVQLLAKRRYDPKGLLNPGKMVTFQPETPAAQASLR